MAGSWADKPLLAVDTETSGVDPFEARIVQVATAVIDPAGRVIDTWERIVDPGVTIPAEAVEVHGITNEIAEAEGVTPRKALAELGVRLWDHIDEFEARAPIVVYNGRYDVPLIMAEVERHGVEVPIVGVPLLDPYLIDRLCDRWRKGRRRLTLVAAHYGVPLAEEEAHGALADAIAAGRIMRKLIETYPELREHTLAGLTLRQTHGHEQDRQRFVDWKRRNSDPEFDTPAGWPIPVEQER